jgi:hypothetical protein
MKIKVFLYHLDKILLVAHNSLQIFNKDTLHNWAYMIYAYRIRI